MSKQSFIEKYSIEVKNGLYIGDLCYVLSDSVYYGVWDEKYHFENGAYTDPETGLQFAMVSTKYGDGEYVDDADNEYPVDAGIIGICDLDLCKRPETDPEFVGHVLKDYEGEVSIEYDDETGCITIDGDGFTTFIETGDDDDYFSEYEDEDEDEYEDEYDDEDEDDE